jgi:uncharacterized phage protein gp47/JayE
MFTNIKDEYQILNDMMELVVVDTNKNMGGFIYDSLSPCANQMAEQYMEIRSNLARSFLEYSDGIFLESKAREFGIERKQGSKAIAKVIFEGIEGTIIPIGFKVQTKSGIIYETIDSYTISETGRIEGYVKALENGDIYNTEIDEINQIPVVLTGLFSVRNVEKASGGSYEETDEDLIARTLEKIRNPATSGNKAHYMQWALSVETVGAAKVLPLHEGPGTVKVLVIDINKEPANSAIIKEVYDLIDTERPIGVTVTVESAKTLPIDIKADVLLDDTVNVESVKTELEKAVSDYLKDIAFKKDFVSIAKIGSMLLSINGVSDYSNLTINGRSYNTNIAFDEVAVIGGVVLND